MPGEQKPKSLWQKSGRLNACPARPTEAHNSLSQNGGAGGFACESLVQILLPQVANSRRFGLYAALVLGACTSAGQAVAPTLTVDEAVTLAAKANRQVQSSALGVQKAGQETSEIRTLRWPQFNAS